MSRAIADAVAASGVGHVVALSTVAAGQPGATGPAAGLRELEERLSRLGDRNLLVLRSPFYMENLLAALPLIQAKGSNASAVDGDLELPMIATRDVVAEAAERLARRDFSGHQVKLLVGPEDVSLRAATRALGERLGLPEVGYVQLPPADVQGALMASACPRPRPRTWWSCSSASTGTGRSRPCATPPTPPPRPGWCPRSTTASRSWG